MKKLTSLLCMFALLVPLAACSDGTGDSKVTEEKKEIPAETVPEEEENVPEEKETASNDLAVPKYHYESEYVTLDAVRYEGDETEGALYFEVKNTSDINLYPGNWGENDKTAEEVCFEPGAVVTKGYLCEMEDGVMKVDFFLNYFDNYELDNYKIPGEPPVRFRGVMTYDPVKGVVDTSGLADVSTKVPTAVTYYDEGGLTVVQEPVEPNKAGRSRMISITNNTGHTLFVPEYYNEMPSGGATVIEVPAGREVRIFDFDNKDSIGKGCDGTPELGVVSPQGYWIDPAYPTECVTYLCELIVSFKAE